MGNIVDRLAAPCDASILPNPMPCGDDDEELDYFGDGMETPEEAAARMSRIRERTAPTYSRKHALCSTNDAAAGFTLVAFEQLRPLVYVLSLYSFIFTLKTWSYLSFVQYYLANPRGVRITSADGVIYVAALVAGWVTLALIVATVGFVNMFLKEKEPALADSEARGQALGSGIEALLRFFHTRNTSSQLAVEDIEKMYLDHQTMAQHAKEKLNYWTVQRSTNPYFRLTRDEEDEEVRLKALVYDYDNGDFKIVSRRTRLLQIITMVLWISDIWMFVIDASVFVHATWEPVSGGINVFLGFSLVIGVASAIFPPWFIYQKFALRLIKTQLL